jgi:hypothetical protein
MSGSRGGAGYLSYAASVSDAYGIDNYDFLEHRDRNTSNWGSDEFGNSNVNVGNRTVGDSVLPPGDRHLYDETRNCNASNWDRISSSRDRHRYDQTRDRNASNCGSCDRIVTPGDRHMHDGTRFLPEMWDYNTGRAGARAPSKVYDMPDTGLFVGFHVPSTPTVADMYGVRDRGDSRSTRRFGHTL